MKKIIILIGLFFSFYAMADSNLLTQSLNNNLWNTVLFQNPDTNSTVIPYKMKESFSKKDLYLYETRGGLVGGILGAFPGLLLAFAGSGWTSATDDFTQVFLGVVSAELGAIIWVPIGVMIAGKKVGEKGSYWKTLAGTLIGNILGLGAGYLTYGVMDDLFHSGEVAATIVSGGIGGACSIAGAVWGYNWR